MHPIVAFGGRVYLIFSSSPGLAFLKTARTASSGRLFSSTAASSGCVILGSTACSLGTITYYAALRRFGCGRGSSGNGKLHTLARFRRREWLGGLGSRRAGGRRLVNHEGQRPGGTPNIRNFARRRLGGNKRWFILERPLPHVGKFKDPNIFGQWHKGHFDHNSKGDTGPRPVRRVLRGAPSAMNRSATFWPPASNVSPVAINTPGVCAVFIQYRAILRSSGVNARAFCPLARTSSPVRAPLAIRMHVVKAPWVGFPLAYIPRLLWLIGPPEDIGPTSVVNRTILAADP